MLKDIIINYSSWKSTGLPFTNYVVLWLLHNKEYKQTSEFVTHLFGIEDSYLGEAYDILEQDGWLKINGDHIPDDIVVRQKFIDCLIANITGNITDDIELWIDEYRGVFKGKRIGSMGDRESCIDKMHKFLTKYPDYTKEQIIKATELYVATQGPHYTYLQQADYFIFKKEEGTKVIKSRLAGHLEETASGEIVMPGDFAKMIN